VTGADGGGGAHRIVDDLGADGFGWILDESYTRSSHALAREGRVWLLDPLDVPGLDDRVAALGTPVAVVQLLDRHHRDCAAIAARLTVPHLVCPPSLPGSPFEVIRIVDRSRWREVALWWPERRVLVAADALGTNRFFAGRERLGVHPLLRLLKPPGVLARYEPEHVLVGHGEGVHGPDAAVALQRAFATARTGLPRWGVDIATAIVRGEIR
jgi:hypothetical protein